MKILYVDVYFLINFTVDILALYFGALFAKIKSTFPRLIIASLVGSAFAVAVALIRLQWYVFIPLALISAFIVCYVFSGAVGYIREFKLFFAFIIFETLMGGAVSFVFGYLDGKLYPILTESDVFNRRLLTLAIALLLAFGLIKFLFYLFSGAKNEKNIKFKVYIGDKSIQFEGLIDSGNLLIDPFTGNAVIIIKRKSFGFFEDVRDLRASEDERIKKRIRFIPTSTVGGKGLLVGVRADCIVFEGSGKTIYNMIVALDENEGSFGGYAALVPSAACD